MFLHKCNDNVTHKMQWFQVLLVIKIQKRSYTVFSYFVIKNYFKEHVDTVS